MRITFLALLACSAFAVSPASAQRPYTDLPIVREGKTIRLSPNVYVIPDENRRGVPNVGIVVGSRATLVIDPGMGLKSGQAVMREVAKVSKGSEIYIVTTHLHPEHTTGASAFPPDAKLIRAVAQQRDVDENAMWWVNEFSSRSPELADLLKDVKSFPAPSETFEREKTLDLGGVRVRLILLGPGHTPGDTVIFVEGDAVMFSGDLAMKQVFPAFTSPQSRADTWLAAVYRHGGAASVPCRRFALWDGRRIHDLRVSRLSHGATGARGGDEGPGQVSRRNCARPCAPSSMRNTRIGTRNRESNRLPR